MDQHSGKRAGCKQKIGRISTGADGPGACGFEQAVSKILQGFPRRSRRRLEEIAEALSARGGKAVRP